MIIIRKIKYYSGKRPEKESTILMRAGIDNSLLALSYTMKDSLKYDYGTKAVSYRRKNETPDRKICQISVIGLETVGYGQTERSG